jgi:hypothetical protein
MPPSVALITSGLCAVLLLHPPSARGQSMELECPKPGTVLKFKSGSTVRAVGQGGGFCQVHSSVNGALDVYALMYSYTDARKKEPAWAKYIDPIQVERLYPLTVGKKHSGRATLPGGTYQLDYVVTSFEKLDTPMGSEDVFVVELLETGVDNSYSAKAKWWISPRYRYLLKFEFRDSRGGSADLVVTEASVPN